MPLVNAALCMYVPVAKWVEDGVECGVQIATPGYGLESVCTVCIVCIVCIVVQCVQFVK